MRALSPYPFVADRLANAANYSLRPKSGEDLKDLETMESVIALNLSPMQLATIWQKAETALQNSFHLFN